MKQVNIFAFDVYLHRNFDRYFDKYEKYMVFSILLL